MGVHSFECRFRAATGTECPWAWEGAPYADCVHQLKWWIANSRDLVLGALDARPASLAEAFHAVAASAGSPADDDNAQDVAA